MGILIAKLWSLFGNEGEAWRRRVGAGRGLQRDLEARVTYVDVISLSLEVIFCLA